MYSSEIYQLEVNVILLFAFEVFAYNTSSHRKFLCCTCSYENLQMQIMFVERKANANGHISIVKTKITLLKPTDVKQQYQEQLHFRVIVSGHVPSANASWT